MLKAVILVGGDRKGKLAVKSSYPEALFSEKISNRGDVLAFDLIVTHCFLSGTRFRPLSLDIPKPLFPIGGMPIIEHHIQACESLNMQEILIIGSYQAGEMKAFLDEVQGKYRMTIRYLQEVNISPDLYYFK